MDSDSEDDAALVARCRRGEQAAWAALVQRHKRLVYTVVRRGGLDDHDAADVFQTVFSRLLTHLERIAEPERLRAWIVTTAKREVWLQRSRGLRNVPLPSEQHDEGAAGGGPAAAADFADPGETPEAMLEQLQRAELVRTALDRLDERCRGLLTLLFADEDERVPYDEVARRLAMPVGSIGPTRARCLAKLRELLR